MPAKGRFDLFANPSANGRYLRILAIASRSPKGRNPPNAEGELLVPECPARHRLPHVEREANEGGPRTSQKGGQRAYKGPLGNGESAP